MALDSGRPTHSWLRSVSLAYVPGQTSPLLNEVIDGLLRQAQQRGHQIQSVPDQRTDAILTTGLLGEVVSWRKALLLSARRRFRLNRTPTVFTLVHASPGEVDRLLYHFQTALAKDPPDLADFQFPGLAPQAHRVLIEQGRRGGPILALERLVQAQAKSIRVILLLGGDSPQRAYHFDLVGAHPRSEAEELTTFYDDIVLRIATTVCTDEVTEHQAVGGPIPYAFWQSLSTPGDMIVAARRLGERHFFTEMVQISDLVQVPSVGDAVARQYSEGCFSTWDPVLGALIATVTGSARPVDKSNITDDDLAVVLDVRPDGRGVLARQVEGKRYSPPSSEALEMIAMDRALPTIQLGQGWSQLTEVPVARSKLHGHRGISAYDPRYVEFVPLRPQYYYYLVSCATAAQAQGIEEAFARSEALQEPDDPRHIVFTVLPGHGTFVVEKWMAGKVPLQLIWEYMDAGHLQVDNYIPQGPLAYVRGPDALLRLETL